MEAKKEILDFINTNETNGALLVTGNWGCGKSYIIKGIADDLNKDVKYAVVVVSLFGIDSIASVNVRVKDAYLEVNSSLLGNSARKVYKAMAKIAKESAAICAAASPDSPTAAAISAGTSSVASLNPFNAISVKNTVGTGKKQKQFVLIFDDFERCKIPRIDLLGAINEYSENRKIRTILIADESKITGDDDEKIRKEYKEFKEKLVSRTIKLTPDFNDAITSIIREYKETVPGYIGFLRKNAHIVQQVFFESKTENLRSLKSYLMDFERVFEAWKESGVSVHYINPVFYMFGAMVFGVKSGTYEEGEYGFLFKDSEMKEIYSKWNGNHILSTLRNWVVDGVWDKDSFIEEAKGRYRVDAMSNDKKFLALSFWDMEQENITEGMPVVLDKAYEGELTCDELIELLKKVAALKKYKVPTPCEVNYSQITDGFRRRKQMVYAGKANEPRRHTFVEKHQIEEDAYELYAEIIRFDDEKMLYANKKTFINYLNGDPDVQSYALSRLPIGVFDENLLKLFLTKYYPAENCKKRELAGVLCRLELFDSNYTAQKDKTTTIGNLRNLIKALNEFSTIREGITVAINNSFVQELTELINAAIGVEDATF